MHLSDYFIELVAYVTYFLRSDESRQISSDQMKNDVQRLLSASEDGMRRGLISSDDYEQARFAVCAWIDESLLNALCLLEQVRIHVTHGHRGPPGTCAR